MLISIVLTVFVYQIIIFQFESPASNADTDRLSTGTTRVDQKVIQDDDFIKSNIISFDNISSHASTSFDNKFENSEIRSIMYSPSTPAIEPSFIHPYPNPPTNFQFSPSFNPLFPDILNSNNSSSDIENDLKTKGKDGFHSAFNATNNHFVAKETKPTFANNINYNRVNTANIISGNTSVQLTPSVDDNINAEDSSENFNLFQQQEEEGIETNTVITKVIDGNGEAVPFDSYIYSSDITFEFLGLKDGAKTDEVDGFECRVDEEDYEECESGILYSVSPVPHRFEARSYSYVGESFDKIYDPTPAMWKWDVGNGFTVQTTLEAVDGNNNPITDGDTTTSNEIVFTFSGSTTAPDEIIEYKRFECTLVEEPGGIPIPFEDEDCDENFTVEDPFTGDLQQNLPPGTYTFTVTAVVNYSEQEHFGNPESITWTIDAEEPIVVETTLEAEDGNGNIITDGDTTTSNDIVFNFTGMTNAPDGSFTERWFECTLVEEPGDVLIFISDDCGSPVTGVNPFTGTEEFNLDPGTYNFTVAACIDVNEEEELSISAVICDSTPESITWTIEEPIVVETTLEAEDGNGNIIGTRI